VILPALGIHRWLSPSVRGKLRRPVQAYLVVISSMVALSLATAIAHGGFGLVLAATMFFLSDVLVAREKFVASAFANRLVGLSLYYVAQLLFATSPSWS
jgi:uncharacterized membrane protein YhhN